MLPIFLKQKLPRNSPAKGSISDTREQYNGGGGASFYRLTGPLGVFGGDIRELFPSEPPPELRASRLPG